MATEQIIEKRTCHIIYVGDGWSGSVRAKAGEHFYHLGISWRKRKKDLVDAMRIICREMVSGDEDSIELFIHNRNGMIQRRHTYGRDPRASKG